MEERKDVIYPSSKEALMKIFILLLTLGLSIFASLVDYRINVIKENETGV